MRTSGCWTPSWRCAGAILSHSVEGYQLLKLAGPPSGVADDAIFAKTGSGAGCIADEFARKGIYFDPAQKGDRVSGWQRMRRLLADAGKPDRSGLYVSRACRYWWLTAPYAGRDLKRQEDVDSSGADHALDAMRYGVHRIEWAKDIKVQWNRW